MSLVGASFCCISTKGGGSFPPQLGPGKQNWSLDPRSTPRREGEGCAHLQEAAQAVEVAAGAEGGLVEVLQQQDERGVPGGLRAAQLLGDGEELALHLGAVQQQHSPGDTGTGVRWAGRLLVAQRPAESHARWQRPLASAAPRWRRGARAPLLGAGKGGHAPSCCCVHPGTTSPAILPARRLLGQPWKGSSPAAGRPKWTSSMCDEGGRSRKCEGPPKYLPFQGEPRSIPAEL